MIVISSREFRQNQRIYFEKADNGEQVIVQRGKDKAYSLTPVTENDMYFNEEMLAKIKRSIEDIKAGKSRTISNSEEIADLLGL